MTKDEVLDFFARCIEKESGIIYESQNLYQLEDRLNQLVRHFAMSSLAELWQKAQGGINGEFRQLLIDLSTNNETSFFRDTKFFECLERRILPRLIEERKGLSALRIWSVASSTGQEPYSLAMILTEIGERLNQAPPSIFATDICVKALERARAGRYNDIEVGRGLPAALKAKYFSCDINHNWILNNKIRSQIDYQALNLRTAFSLNRQFDLILCRNVLIYQRVEAKTEIIKRLTAHLSPGGTFLMGAGESLIGLSQDYQQSLVDGVAVYQRKQPEIAA